MAGKREIKQWITVNGVHVPIFEGESKAEAVKRSIDERSDNSSSKKKSESSSQIDKDEKTKQEQIKKNEEQKKQLNSEKSTVDSKLSKDIESARNGDLTVRDSYIDRLNNINAKLASGRGSAKLVAEASELREKVNQINNAYKESDKFKKEDADWKAFQEEQAAKRAERLKPGKIYENSRGVRIRIEEPTKDGNVQYSFLDKDGRPTETRGGDERSVNKMLSVNGYNEKKTEYTPKTNNDKESDKAKYEAAAKKQDSLQSEYERKYSKEYNKYGDPDPESWGDDKPESASKDYAEVLKAAEERDEAYKNYTKTLKYSDPHNNPYSKDAKVNSVLDIKVRDETFTKNRQEFNRSVYDDYKDSYDFGDDASYEEIFHKMLDDGDAVEDAYKATDWIKGYREAYKLNQDNVSYKGSGEEVDKVNRPVSKKVGKESGSQGGSYENGNYRVTYTNKGLVVRGPNGAVVGTYDNDREADKAIEKHRLSGSTNTSNKVPSNPSNVDNQIKNIDRKIKEIKEYSLAQRLDPYTRADYHKKLEELEKKRKRLLNNKGNK